MLPVTQHHITHIADAQAVHKDTAHRHTSGHICLIFIQLQHIAGGQNKDIILVNPQILCNFSLSLQVLVLSVYRNRIPGMHQGIDQLDLLLTGMSRYMSILEDHVRPLAQQLIDNPGHRLLIARDGVGRKDDRVPMAYGDLLMHIAGHTAQRRHTLSLAAGGDDHLLLVGIVFQLVDLNQRIFRDADTAQIDGRLDDRHHTAAFHYDLAPEFICRIDDLLYPVHIGRKGRHKDTGIFVLLKQGVKGLAHCPLRGRKSRPLRIGGVTHQRQHALLADLRKAGQVNGIAEYRRIIHLEIARMHHRPHRGIDGQGCGIHDTVIRLDIFHTELS